MQAQHATSAASRPTPCRARPKPRRERTTRTALYWQARNVATIETVVTPGVLMDHLDICHGTAERLIAELQHDGVLGEPDMFGVYALAGQSEEGNHV